MNKDKGRGNYRGGKEFSFWQVPQEETRHTNLLNNINSTKEQPGGEGGKVGNVLRGSVRKPDDESKCHESSSSSDG